MQDLKSELKAASARGGDTADLIKGSTVETFTDRESKVLKARDEFYALKKHRDASGKDMEDLRNSMQKIDILATRNELSDLLRVEKISYVDGNEELGNKMDAVPSDKVEHAKKLWSLCIDYERTAMKFDKVKATKEKLDLEIRSHKRDVFNPLRSMAHEVMIDSAKKNGGVPQWLDCVQQSGFRKEQLQKYWEEIEPDQKAEVEQAIAEAEEGGIVGAAKKVAMLSEKVEGCKQLLAGRELDGLDEKLTTATTSADELAAQLKEAEAECFRLQNVVGARDNLRTHEKELTAAQRTLMELSGIKMPRVESDSDEDVESDAPDTATVACVEDIEWEHVLTTSECGELMEVSAKAALNEMKNAAAAAKLKMRKNDDNKWEIHTESFQTWLETRSAE
jgi:hypothetical protein